MIDRTNRRRLLPIVTLFILVILLLQLYHKQLVIEFLWTLQNDESDPKLYFESDESYKERLMLQRNIMFGSVIKRVDNDNFDKREGYNESFLDSLPIMRNDIPDFQPKSCKSKEYRPSNTKVSVVINYHNELLSLLLRSIYTVIASIPARNFHELILIDDGSNLTEHYHLREIVPLMEGLLVPVKYYRFENNVGLIYSRRYACQYATGQAVLVLDSHIEVTPGFLEPLLQITDKNYKAIAAPVFDFWDTFQNKFWSYDGAALGFDKYLTWISVQNPKDEKPFATPSILGGAFLASKKRLEELDYYGRGMIGWGYENIELAMKVWMCGGEILYVPCSRVLHYAAKRSPMNHGDRQRPGHYLHNAAIVVKSFFSDEDFRDFELLNGKDKELYENDEMVKMNKEVLLKNNCTKDFGWMRRTLMPKIESYDGETLIAAKLMVEGQCVTVKRTENGSQEIHLIRCNPNKTARTSIRLTKRRELRMFDRQCLDWGAQNAKFVGCHDSGGNQAVVYDISTGRMSNLNRGKCLVYFMDSGRLDYAPCNGNNEMYKVPNFQFQTLYHSELLQVT